MAVSFDMKMTKYESEKLSINERKSTFDEVQKGFDEITAKKEAGRCLHCLNPMCVLGCPINNKIPDFIEQIKNGKYEKAYEILCENSCLSSVCGRVCDQGKQCERKCVRAIKGEPVAIGMLERFVSDYFEKGSTNLNPKQNIKKNSKKIAVVGGGPAGLACAYDLLKCGYDVTIFEKSNELGGIMVSSIPEYRLPKTVVQKAIFKIKNLGLKVQTNKELGKNLSLKGLFNEGYKAIFVGIGADKSRQMNIDGEELKGVFSAKEFLEQSKLFSLTKTQNEDNFIEKTLKNAINLEKNAKNLNLKEDFENKKVVIVGGGNVALDSARTAVRLGAKTVTVVYRRSENELPAEKSEVDSARQEGVEFKFLTNPVQILNYIPKKSFETKNYEHLTENLVELKSSPLNSVNENLNYNVDFEKSDNENLNTKIYQDLNKSKSSDFVKSIKCVKMELGEPDKSGRRKPVEILGSEFYMLADTVVMAIGSNFNFETGSDDLKIETDKYGAIVINEDTGETNINNVFAGGDDVTGPATIVSAMRAGKKVAISIDKMLSNC